MPLLLPLTGTCYCHRTCLTPACYCRSLASHPPASSRAVLLLLPAGAEGTAAVSPPALQACLQEPEAPRSGQQSAQAPGLQGGTHAHADKEKGQRLAGWVWKKWWGGAGKRGYVRRGGRGGRGQCWLHGRRLGTQEGGQEWGGGGQAQGQLRPIRTAAAPAELPAFAGGSSSWGQ